MLGPLNFEVYRAFLFLEERKRGTLTRERDRARENIA
jgi:hypothetical protein